MNIIIGTLTAFFIGYALMTVFSRSKKNSPSNPSQGGSSPVEVNPEPSTPKEAE